MASTCTGKTCFWMFLGNMHFESFWCILHIRETYFIVSCDLRAPGGAKLAGGTAIISEDQSDEPAEE